MAATRRRKRDEEARARELGETAEETAGERSVAGEAVRLQELLGNVSTTEVMARAALQRDATATDAVPAKAGEETKVAYTMTMSDIGTFDVLSWSWSVTGGAGLGSGGSGKAQMTDLVASKKADKFSSKIMQCVATGQPVAAVELRTQRGGELFVIKLKGVTVNSFQTSDAVETFSLSFAEVEYEVGGEKQ